MNFPKGNNKLTSFHYSGCYIHEYEWHLIIQEYIRHSDSVKMTSLRKWLKWHSLGILSSHLNDKNNHPDWDAVGSMEMKWWEHLARPAEVNIYYNTSMEVMQHWYVDGKKETGLLNGKFSFKILNDFLSLNVYLVHIHYSLHWTVLSFPVPFPSA